MKALNKNELKEIIQSGNLNFLIGSGCSTPYLKILGDIEKKMNEESTKLSSQKEYFEILKKSENITDIEDDDKYLNVSKKNYLDFFLLLAKILVDRKLSIVNKQVNIFTTNFDVFMEDACEKLSLIYNDGFEGRITPIFDVANFNKLQSFKSLQFDNKTDVPVFNIIKLHGSMSWKFDDKDRIIYAKNCESIININVMGNDFEEKYNNKIPLINPNISKHIKTVLDVKYGALLRKLSLELEKENSVLFVIGFSFNDAHIKELVYSVAKSNPTLIIIYFSYEKYKTENDTLKECENQNFYIIDSENNFTFDKTINYLSKIFENDKTKNVQNQDLIEQDNTPNNNKDIEDGSTAETIDDVPNKDSKKKESDLSINKQEDDDLPF